MTAAFAALALAFGLLFVYPYTFYPLLLRLLPKHKRRQRPRRPRQRDNTTALLFCAYNEQAALPRKIENLRMLKAEMPNLEILAYSDCSSDETAELLCGAADILKPVVGARRVGKVNGMQRLVVLTRADILVFTDANVVIAPGSLSRLLGYFDDPEVGCVAGTLVYRKGTSEAESPVARAGGLYWRLEEHIKRLESRSGSTMGADGSFFARRRLGYPRIPADLVDDLAVSLSVLFEGLRCVSAPDVLAYETSVADSSEEFRRKRRIGCGSYSTYRFLRSKIGCLGPIDRFKFVSHKLIRWWGAAFLMLSLAAGVAALLASNAGMPAVALLLTTGALLTFLGWLGAPLLATLYEMLLAVVATGVGILESLRGRRYATWDPAKSR